jgi:Holliday junction DNA helicase RuvA
VGYEVDVRHHRGTPAETRREVFLLVRHVFREDGQALYGFAVAEEREFFELLVEKVSGVGPKMALNILSRLALPILARAASIRGDVALLSQCPGVGKKTAERLVMELKEKAPSASKAPAPVPCGRRGRRLRRAYACDGTLSPRLIALGFKPVDGRTRALRARADQARRWRDRRSARPLSPRTLSVEREAQRPRGSEAQLTRKRQRGLIR